MAQVERAMFAKHDSEPAAPAGEAVANQGLQEGRWYPYLLIAPAMIALIVVGLAPFIYAAWLSLHELRFGQVGEFIWLGNYVDLLTSGAFWNSMGVAALFVLIAVPIQFMLGLGGALVLAQGVYFRRLLVPILFIPSIMAPIVVGLLGKLMFAGSWGLISYNVFERFGFFGGTSLFASPDYAIYGLIFIDIWQWTPFMMLAFYAGLQARPTNPYRAAAVDGASKFQMFVHLTLPLIAPLLAVILLLRIIDAFKVFDTIFILTNGGPGDATESPSVLAYKMVFEYWNIGEATAMAVLVWIIFFVFCNIFYQVGKRKLGVF